MAESGPATDDLRKTLNWLDEQRQLDRERILQIARYVEGLAEQIREQGSVLAVHEAAANRASEHEGRTGDLLPALAERVARIDRLLEEQSSMQARSAQIENAQRERDRRLLADLAQQVEGIARTVESSVNRIGALAEEVRRERDARVPLTRGIEEIQRTLSGLNGRIGLLDEQVRRLAGNAATLEQSLEKYRGDLSRIDSTTKILDLRLGRDLTVVQKLVTEWQEHTEDQLKPIVGLTKQVVTLVEQRDAMDERLAQVRHDLENQRDTLARLEAGLRADRTAFERIADAAETQARRVEQGEAAVWQVGEHLTALVDQITHSEREIESLGRRIEEVDQRLGNLADDQRQVAADLVSLSEATQGRFLTAEGRAAQVDHQLSSTIQALAEQVRARQRVRLEHFRRTVDELTQQLSELEASQG